MLQTPIRFAIFGNQYQAHKSASLQKVLTVLDAAGAELTIDKEYADFLTGSQKIDIGNATVFEGNDFDADFVISMGGDGTFLMVANRVGSKQTPIIGVNMGRLGFLADISPNDIDREIKTILRGDYSIEERTVISVFADGKPLVEDNCALNDIAILKRDDASMITIEAEINGETLTTYEADGLIVSTTTGSTAYSLSVGGPILVPQTGILCLTPVAPHSLSIRPVVISDTSKITLSVESRSHQYLVAIDGRSVSCQEGTRLTVKKANHVVKVVKRNGQSYFKTLREKMMWGAKAKM